MTSYWERRREEENIQSIEDLIVIKKFKNKENKNENKHRKNN